MSVTRRSFNKIAAAISVFPIFRPKKYEAYVLKIKETPFEIYTSENVAIKRIKELSEFSNSVPELKFLILEKEYINTNKNNEFVYRTNKFWSNKKPKRYKVSNSMLILNKEKKHCNICDIKQKKVEIHTFIYDYHLDMISKYTSNLVLS